MSIGGVTQVCHPGRRGGRRNALLACLLALLLSACSSSPLSSQAVLPQADRAAQRVGPESASSSRYGHAVAATDEFVVVGAWNAEVDGVASGAVYIYGRDAESGEWELEKLLAGPGVEEGGRFGYALAAHGDTIAVGAIYDSSVGERAGSVYIFRRTGQGWQQEAKLTPDPGENLYFGGAVELHGTTLAVGASGPLESSVNLFEFDGDSWVPVEQLSVQEPSHIRFGSDLALDSTALLVGAWSDDPSEPGRAYLYERADAGWQQRVSLVSPDGNPQYGSAVGLSEEYLFVASTEGGGEGRVAVYRRADPSQQPVATLVPPDRQPHFGSSIDVVEGELIVGSPGATVDGKWSGAVYRFSAEKGDWQQIGEFMHPRPADDQAFGGALAATTQWVAVGASGERTDGNVTGAVVIFPREATNDE